MKRMSRKYGMLRKSVAQEAVHRFSPEVCKKIGHYVYRLVDPRNGETFYVGRGQNNRIFEHIDDARKSVPGEKCDKIRQIHQAGLAVLTLIHRHGLRTMEEAKVVEAALIDAYPGIANEQGGAGSADFGVRSAQEIIAEYEAPLAEFGTDKIVLISISQGWIHNIRNFDLGTWEGVYDQTRYCWVIRPARAEQADYVIGHALGLIRGVFVAERWLSARDPVFSKFGPDPKSNRYGFIGRKAPDNVWRRYVKKQVPLKYRQSTGQPIQYVNIPS